MRVFLGLVEISGYYASLGRGLRAAGVEVRQGLLSKHPFGYPHTPPGPAWSLILRLEKWRSSGRWAWALGLPACAVVRSWLLLESLLWADVIVLATGTTFLWGLDLPLYRLFGKRLVVVFHGSDARPLYLDGGFFPGEAGPEWLRKAEKVLRKQVKRLSRLEHHADLIINNPMTSQLFERKSANFIALGMPICVDPGFGLTPKPKGEGRPIRILHSPSVPLVKGTPVVRAAIAKLRERHDIEYQELTGVPHDEVLARLQWADVVIDQCYSDLPLANFATEAGLSGCLVMMGGYLLHQGPGAFGLSGFPPVHFFQPEALEAALESVLEAGPERIHAQGEALRQWILAHWNQDAIAQRFLSMLAGHPDAGWFEPRDFANPYGAAVSKEVLEARMAIISAEKGDGFFHLAHRPDVLHAMHAALGPGRQEAP